MAVGAGLDLLVLHRLFAALGGLFEGDGQVGLDIAAPPWGVGVGPAGPAAEAPEEAIEDVGEVEAPLEGAAAPGAAAEVGVYPRVAELVVPGPLLLVGEDLVGLVDLLELLLGLLVPGVQVRVVLLRQLPVCFFDLVLRGALLYAQHLVIIAFLRQVVSPASPKSRDRSFLPLLWSH